MSIEWERDDSGLSIRDIESKRAYEMVPHQFAVVKKLAWLRCKRCGLVNLRNALTEWCVKKGCNASDHPEYAARCRAARPKGGDR